MGYWYRTRGRGSPTSGSERRTRSTSPARPGRRRRQRRRRQRRVGRSCWQRCNTRRLIVRSPPSGGRWFGPRSATTTTGVGAENNVCCGCTGAAAMECPSAAAMECPTAAMECPSATLAGVLGAAAVRAGDTTATAARTVRRRPHTTASPLVRHLSHGEAATSRDVSAGDCLPLPAAPCPSPRCTR